MACRALLVDDERLARSQLRTMLAEHPSVEVVGEARAVPQAVEAVRSLRPDVVFLDIEMPGASGFDLLQELESRCQTIFVTAHDRFAVRAFNVNALDYLLKPVERERLARAVQKLSFRLASPQRAAWPLNASDYLFVSNSSSARLIQIYRIKYILAAGPYSEIFSDDGNKWMMLRSMKEWQARLPSKKFARIHRSTLVNLDWVDRIEPLANWSYRVTLQDGKTQLLMSRRGGAMLKERLA